MRLIKLINQKPYGKVISPLAIPIWFEINMYTDYRSLVILIYCPHKYKPVHRRVSSNITR